MNKQLFAVILSIGISILPLFGQANLAQIESSKIYQQGVELFEKGKFNIAYNYFEKYLTQIAEKDFAKATLEQGKAEYYKAVCAKATNSPLAENLLLDFIEEYAGNSAVYSAYFHLGDLYFSKANYKDAIEYFEKTEASALTETEKDELIFKKAFSNFALKKFSESYHQLAPLTQKTNSIYNYDAIYYSGLSAYYLEKYDDALKQFKKLDNSPKYKTIVPYYIASILAQGGKYDEMIQYIEPQLESVKGLRYPNEIKKLLGNAYFEKKYFLSSEKYLSQAIPALGKVNQEDYYQLGYVYYKNGQYQKAIEQLKKLTTLDNEMIQSAMYILGQCYTKIGDKGNAKTAFQQAAKMKYNPLITEESLFNIAKITYEQGNNTEALSLLKTFIATYPNSEFNTHAQNILADVFFKTRSYEEAINMIENMKNPTAQIKSAYQQMSFYRAMEYYSNNQMLKANEYLDKSLRFTSESSIEALTYYWKGDIAHNNNNYEESNQWLSKFQSIAATISTEHSSRVNAGTGFYLQGYNSYKKSDFVSSQILFTKAIDRLKSEKDVVIQQTVLPDAQLRLADSYYMQKKYSDALNYYQQVINSNAKGADYATYQSAMLKGLTGKTNDKIDGLNQVFAKFANSTYADDALFELGSTYNNIDRSKDAINTYQLLLKNYPKSEFVPYVYNRVALIQYNQGNLDAALSSYKYVIQKFPKTPASQEALIAVKDIYIDKGDPNGYFDLMKQYPGAMVSTSTQDSIVYQAAEAQFVKGNYELAIKGFDSYLNTYKNGAFVLPSRYYRAESKYYNGNIVGSVVDYEYVIEQPTNRYSEKSLQRAADIKSKQGDAQKAATYYESLIEVASTEDLLNEAMLGALRSYYQINNYSKTIDYANKVMAIKGMPETVQVEAMFYRGMAQFKNKNLSATVPDLESVIKRINNEWAAESKYTIALIAYQNSDMVHAEKLCFEFISNYPSYPTWMVKTYILLSDIYVKNGDYFKAKVTLQSVLDSYHTQDALYKEAVEKLERVKTLESQGSKLVNPTGANGFSEFEK
ncbi:MAG: tetratricopeptide repeat protein [Chitinophagales bacterium]|nr:tetratricopeptide repeat protein [Chitinophagales bacterium]MCZ2393369.1 tetratricopeptide repeat protein [Chitinophagales bacterium]